MHRILIKEIKGLSLKTSQVAWPPIHSLTSRVDLMAFSNIIIHNFLIRPAPLEVDRGAVGRKWGSTERWILLLAMGMDQGMNIAAWDGL